MIFDDIETGTISTSQQSINQLAEMVSEGQEITCSELVIDTDDGEIVVSPVATDLKITAVDT
jgi:hypothetical protein